MYLREMEEGVEDVDPGVTGLGGEGEAVLCVSPQGRGKCGEGRK